MTFKRFVSNKISPVILLVAGMWFTSCGIQSIPQAKNQTDATFAEIMNVYKRRADLIPNLVGVVQGYASHEKDTLQAVVEARSKATGITLDPSKATPEQIQAFQNSQGSLTQALGKLMMITENYPQLKADRNFSELQSQLEGTENRIAVARNRHIEAILAFNNLVTVPPTSWTNSLFYRHPVMPQWTVGEAEAQTIQSAPKVDFKQK